MQKTLNVIGAEIISKLFMVTDMTKFSVKNPVHSRHSLKITGYILIIVDFSHDIQKD